MVGNVPIISASNWPVAPKWIIDHPHLRSRQSLDHFPPDPSMPQTPPLIFLPLERRPHSHANCTGAGKSVLGISWASRGALLGPLGAILRPRMAIGSEKARRQKSLVFVRFLNDFGLLEASLGSSLASWSRLEAVLGPLGASSKPS